MIDDRGECDHRQPDAEEQRRQEPPVDIAETPPRLNRVSPHQGPEGACTGADRMDQALVDAEDQSDRPATDSGHHVG